MATQLVRCNNPNCGLTFRRKNTEVNRSNKLGRPMFCSRSCSGKVNHSHLTYRDTSHLDSGNRRDKYTGFREHLKRAIYRRGATDLSLDALLSQWNRQEGKCVYTGVLLVHPVDFKADTPDFHKASLDRIDSAFGYVNNNVQFISATCNYAKHSMTHEQMLIFCGVVADYWR